MWTFAGIWYRNWFWSLQLVDLAHHQEDDKRDDKELDDRIEENTIVDGGCTSSLGIRKAGIALAADIPIKLGKIHLAQQQTDGRHDDVVYQRGDNLAECGTDDDANRQVNDTSFDCKFPEFFEHFHFPLYEPACLLFD